MMMVNKKNKAFTEESVIGVQIIIRTSLKSFSEDDFGVFVSTIISRAHEKQMDDSDAGLFVEFAYVC